MKGITYTRVMEIMKEEERERNRTIGNNND